MAHEVLPGRQRILVIHLTTRAIEMEDVAARDVARFLGGRGVAAALLAKSVDGPIDPVTQEAPLIFSMGALTGTNAPMTGRSSVTFVSPATGLYCKSNVGGHFGLYCRLSGVDYILIDGIATSPVYVSIGSSGIEIRDARPFWGMPVRQASRALEAEHGTDLNVACIGPAGENGVVFATIMSSVYNAAARGGGGAVMGSKRLKAIVVETPRGALRPFNPEAFEVIRTDTRDALYADSMADSYFAYGTAASVELMNEMNTLPSYNFQRGSIDRIEELTSQYWNEKGLLKGRIGCASCIYSCHRFIRIDDGPYANTYSAGPEYETVSALGTGPGISSIGALHCANELCNDLGLDTISTGGVIQWAMETHERGLLPAELSQGLDLDFGSEEAVTRLPRMIAHREGLGDLLAEGVRCAAAEIGGDSWKWAIHTRGLEQSRVETRGAMAYALAFAVNPRGPDHLHTECLAEFGMTKEMRELVREITGDAAHARPDTIEKRAEIVRWHEDIYAVSDALGMCAFATTAAYGGSPERCAKLFEAATGLPMSPEGILRAGRRIVTLERLINLRLGWNDDPTEYAPWRLMNERQESLPMDDPILDVARMTKMVREYYALHGWNEETGVPSAAAVAALDLEDLAG